MIKAVLTVFTLMLLLCTICLSGLSYPVKASGTIFIRADGSVEPDTAPIFTIDNDTYTFTDNIYDEIVVERDNIVVDGKGYTVQGAGSGTGIYLSGRSNVTVKNMEVRAFERGIRLNDSSNNTISANNVTSNSEEGIGLYGSSSSNTVSGNNIVNNSYGIWFYNSYSNWIYPNNFIGNTPQVYPSFYLNFWDAGYPSGGNYWSPQYDDTDIYSGLYQNETGSDGIGDAPYSQDNYPLMGMFCDFNVTSECHVQTICNSTISGFKFNGTATSFNVSDKNETTGFCRICIPTALMNNTFTVLVNSTAVDYYILSCSNDTHNYLYFIYNHSTQEVIIIPEFPSCLILSVFMTATLLAAIMYNKKDKQIAEASVASQS